MSLKELTIMDEIKIKNIIEDLIDTFLMAGELSIKLREKGLNKEIKSDNTPYFTFIHYYQFSRVLYYLHLLLFFQHFGN